MIFFLIHQQNYHINFPAVAGCFNTLLKTNKSACNYAPIACVREVTVASFLSLFWTFIVNFWTFSGLFLDLYCPFSGLIDMLHRTF
jgi:hypothetical protein